MEKLWAVYCEHLGKHPLSFTGPLYKSLSKFDVADRYLWQMGDKTIPDKALLSLKSFYPPWVTGINLLVCVVHMHTEHITPTSLG